MATSHPAERLRAFFAEKRREVYFRAQRELEDEATKKKTAKTKKFCVAEEEAKYSEANLGRCLGFVKELEAKFAGDATTASAFVDLMRAFLTRGSLEEVAGVAVALFDGELLESFASIVGSTADDIRTLHEAKPQQQKKRGRKPSDKSSPGGGAPASKKLKKTSSSKVTWRVDEDERMGSFFLHEGERSLEAVARVDAWSLKEESEERSYRGTLLLGARQGTLVEVTGLPQHLSDDLVTVLKLCEPLPSSWNETLRGGSSSIFRTAAKKLDLDRKLDPAWTDRFGRVVWALDKATEPPWPATILDPRGFEDDALLDRASNLVGKKHVVRFFGLPLASSLGFVLVNKLSPFVSAIEHSARASLIKRQSSRNNFLEACRLAEAAVNLNDRSRTKLPAPGDVVRVTYDGDPTAYLCNVHLNDADGSMFVTSDQFSGEDKAGIPFCPDEDDWAFLPSSSDDAAAADVVGQQPPPPSSSSEEAAPPPPAAAAADVPAPPADDGDETDIEEA
mmetsp:Transcript_8284/g.25592  ORF Transcript_8284/g.25592 Transcript_8284/m.25592 type:complete len:506 (+) Transcript_8284:71-1588(+)